ncbi:MAG: EAL domain-containing protein [Geminicoccaceae bacterium]
MPVMFWISLAAGYLVGVSACLAFLPPDIVAALLMPVALTAFLVAGAAAVVLMLANLSDEPEPPALDLAKLSRQTEPALETAGHGVSFLAPAETSEDAAVLELGLTRALPDTSAKTVDQSETTALRVAADVDDEIDISSLDTKRDALTGKSPGVKTQMAIAEAILAASGEERISARQVAKKTLGSNDRARQSLRAYGGRAVPIETPDDGLASRRPDEPRAARSAAAQSVANDPRPDPSDVKRAIEAVQVELLTQPIVTLPQRRPVFVEGSSRLRLANGSTVGQATFLPIAHEMGMVPELNHAIVQQATAVIARLKQRGLRTKLFLRIAKQTLDRSASLHLLSDLMERRRLAADQLVFEVERSAADGRTRSAIGALHHLGITFSLNRLIADPEALRSAPLWHDIGVRFVKLDIDSVAGTLDAPHLDPKILSMAKRLEDLGLALIVSSVADERLLTALMNYPIAYAQGDLFGAAERAVA